MSVIFFFVLEDSEVAVNHFDCFEYSASPAQGFWPHV